MKIIVIGAGAAGLGIGWRLAQAGAETVIVERAQPGRGASWASAGMISTVADPAEQNEAVAGFARRARALWPQFAVEIEQGSGRTIGFRVDGKLSVAQSDEDWTRLSTVSRAASARGEPASMLSASEARAREPMLGPDIAGALWSPDEAQVDNRSLGIALAAAFLNAGGSLQAAETVVRLELRGERVGAARTPFALHEADAFVLAAGAWTGQIEGLPREFVPPVIPVKGEMIALAPPPGATLPRAMIEAHDVYLVPRHERLFVGATLERVGFDTRLNSGAARGLKAAATHALPALANWDIAEQWAGLRPGSPDDLPILGAGGIAGLFLATGQYRNGILYAPAIADSLCNVILARRDEPDLAAFDPRRFAQPTN